MKTWKVRSCQRSLVIMTLLTMLPTSALAVSGIGKGITITKDQAYWSTRLLANGAIAAIVRRWRRGKAALPRQRPRLSQRHAVISLILIPTLRTSTDADTVLKTAIATTAAREMDAMHALPMSSG